MEQTMIADMILQNRMVLYGQPKWTFGKNTCNTYEVFVEYIKMQDGTTIPAWPILEIVEKDEALTMLFSHWLLWNGVRATIALSESTKSNLTLSLNLLPKYAENRYFVQEVENCLKETGFDPHRLQFELSELQDLSEEGAANLNKLHDELGIALMMGNFGSKHTNVPLLYMVHFDGLELTKDFAPQIPANEDACKIVIGIQHMAVTMDMNVCVKGVDNQDQFEFFEDIGVYKGQGPLIGNPMPLNELEDYIKMYALRKGHK